MQFLYEAHLIGFLDNQLKLHDSIITLNGANLFDVYLGGSSLRGVDFKGAILQEADLDHADLSYANLSCTTPGVPILYGHGASLGITQCTLLNDANLIGVYLIHANLGGAIFTHTKLKYANLSSANLSMSDDFISSINLTQQQLDQVNSCENAILPKGLTCHRNQ